MKVKGAKRALVLANVFNLLVAIYLIVIAIVSLVKLRWYHQLTLAIKMRHLITSATSYFAFFILIFAGLVLITIFVLDTIRLQPKTYVSPSSDQNIVAITPPPPPTLQPEEHQQSGPGSHLPASATNTNASTQAIFIEQQGTFVKQRTGDVGGRLSPTSLAGAVGRSLMIRESSSPTSQSAVCCSILLYLFASVSLIVVLILWLLNTGELVRDSISTQLDAAFSKYQFSNRSNPYSVAVDGMQDVNNCCGSLDYTDFPHQRISGLSSGHYPGSCCGKNIFGVNARVLCTPEEIYRARQTTGCTTVLSNYYDLMSLLIVPVALVSLFVNITIIGLIVIARMDSSFDLDRTRETGGRDKFELKSGA